VVPHPVVVVARSEAPSIREQLTCFRAKRTAGLAWIDITTGTITELTDASANPVIGAHAMQCCA